MTNILLLFCPARPIAISREMTSVRRACLAWSRWATGQMSWFIPTDGPSCLFFLLHWLFQLMKMVLSNSRYHQSVAAFLLSFFSLGFQSFNLDWTKRAPDQWQKLSSFYNSHHVVRVYAKLKAAVPPPVRSHKEGEEEEEGEKEEEEEVWIMVSTGRSTRTWWCLVREVYTTSRTL